MNKLAIAVGLGAGLTMGSAAYAGYSYASPVYISSGSGAGLAEGSLHGARHSTDGVQYIGCEIDGYSSGYRYVSCAATDAQHHQKFCYTTTPSAAELNALSLINESSFLYFAVDSSGRCVNISVNNDSSHL
jgi:hypothetical protein